MPSFWPRTRPQTWYQPIQTSGSAGYYEDQEPKGYSASASRHRSPNRRLYIVSFLNLGLFALSLLLAADSYHAKAVLLSNKGNALLRASDWFSPVHDRLQINIIPARVNGTLLDTDHSIFRQPPSPEVDAAWDRVGSLLPHMISSSDVVRLGKDPSKVAKAPPEWGYGPDAYLAELDVMHTIHCLNAIRRDVHWQHYFGHEYPTGDFPELHRIHTDHCIYIVLQDLMCHATGDMITTPWVDGQLNPFPDFNINRKCRDFGGVLRWHEETCFKDVAAYKALRKPEDLIPYRMSDEFYDKFGSDEGLFAPFHTHDHHQGHGE